MDAQDVHVAGSSANNSVSLAVDALQCAGWLRNKHHMKPRTVHAMRRAPSPRRRMQMMGSVCRLSPLSPALAAEDTWSVLTLSRSCRCREKNCSHEHPRLGQGDKGPMRILSMAKKKEKTRGNFQLTTRKVARMKTRWIRYRRLPGASITAITSSHFNLVNLDELLDSLSSS